MRLMEALRKAPVNDKQVKQFMEIMEKPLPACIAISKIHVVIDDDSLFDEIQHASLSEPEKDARPIIADWVSKNHPTMLRDVSEDDLTDGHWYMSPISTHPTNL